MMTILMTWLYWWHDYIDDDYIDDNYIDDDFVVEEVDTDCIDDEVDTLNDDFIDIKKFSRTQMQ